MCIAPYGRNDNQKIAEFPVSKGFKADLLQRQGYICLMISTKKQSRGARWVVRALVTGTDGIQR